MKRGRENRIKKRKGDERGRKAEERRGREKSRRKKREGEEQKKEEGGRRAEGGRTGGRRGLQLSSMTQQFSTIYRQQREVHMRFIITAKVLTDSK